MGEVGQDRADHDDRRDAMNPSGRRRPAEEAHQLGGPGLLHTILISSEYQRTGVELLDSDLPRRELLRLSVQASLRDAWEAMIDSDKSAVFISGVVAQVAVSGIITREQLEDYYLNQA